MCSHVVMQSALARRCRVSPGRGPRSLGHFVYSGITKHKCCSERILNYIVTIRAGKEFLNCPHYEYQKMLRWIDRSPPTAEAGLDAATVWMQRSTAEAGDTASAEAGLDAASAEAGSDAAWNVSPVSDSFFISERTKNKRPGVGKRFARWQNVHPR